MNPITKQQIQEDVKLVYNKLNKSPTLREYIKHGEYSVSTCKRLFGSWNNTLKYSVGETNLERKENVTKECSNCFKSITVNHCEVKEHNFCSISCSASFNNKLKPKRNKTKTCASCDNKVFSNYKYCKECRDNQKHIKYGDECTINEALYGTGSNTYSRVRAHAKSKVKDREKKCNVCGYDKHVEICHIKAIKDFHKDTKLNVVNQSSNLILLCPNCHWEFDNGDLHL